MFQSKTLRRMTPKTRKLAKEYNALEFTLRRMKKQVEVMAELERDSLALCNQNKARRRDEVTSEDGKGWKDQSALARTGRDLPFD
ncbi:hypothetical protein ES703_124147 [subsurface metagenome]